MKFAFYPPTFLSTPGMSALISNASGFCTNTARALCRCGVHAKPTFLNLIRAL
jgi:hypothetical protein